MSWYELFISFAPHSKPTSAQENQVIFPILSPQKLEFHLLSAVSAKVSTFFSFWNSQWIWGNTVHLLLVSLLHFRFHIFQLFIIPNWRRQWHPTPVVLPGKSHGQRSLVGCSPWGHEESDMTERLHFHFSLSCIGEGNDNSLQCSCLENPRDREAWWAAISGVTESQTQLKWLSSSSK